MVNSERTGVPQHVAKLLLKAGLSPDECKQVDWWIVMQPDGYGLAVYQVEVLTHDGRDLMGWISVDGRTSAELEKHHV